MGIFSRLFGGVEGGEGEQTDDGPKSTHGEPLLATASGAPAPSPLANERHVNSPDDPQRPRSPLPRLPRQAPTESEVKVTFKTPTERADSTQISSPPPPSAPAPAPQVAAPARKPQAVIVEDKPEKPVAGANTKPPLPPAPVPRWSGRPKRDSISEAFERSTSQHDYEQTPTAGISTKEDLDAVRGVFNEVAAVHVAQVRDVMLELRYGDAEAGWIESTKPALKSLRAMAAQLDLTELCEALDTFCVAVEDAIAKRMNEAGKAALLTRYQRLVELIPQAFELDGERDRREPIIIEALLFQIDGVERPIVDKLFGVGLNRLEALLKANVDEIVVVAGIRQEVAVAIVGQLKAYRSSAQSVLAAPDPGSERRQLHDLLITLSIQNDDFNRARGEWTEGAKTRKRDCRKQREQTYQRIKVTLARLGERDQLARLERLSFEERISSLDRYLTAATATRP
ncbi:MAG: hypothetical protein ABI867_19925 [Kofleriaceae bacterium]